MRKTTGLLSVLVAVGVLLASTSMYAADKVKGAGKKECPQAVAIKAKMGEKKAAIEALKGQIKTAKDTAKAAHDAEKAKKQADRAAKLEALKTSNPTKYAKVMEKQAGKKKEDKGNKGEKGKLTPEQKAAKLEKMKTKNPAMYALVSQRVKLHEEMKALKVEMKVTKAGCKG